MIRLVELSEDDIGIGYYLRVKNIKKIIKSLERTYPVHFPETDRMLEDFFTTQKKCYFCNSKIFQNEDLYLLIEKCRYGVGYMVLHEYCGKDKKTQISLPFQQEP